MKAVNFLDLRLEPAKYSDATELVVNLHEPLNSLKAARVQLEAFRGNLRLGMRLCNKITTIKFVNQHSEYAYGGKCVNTSAKKSGENQYYVRVEANLDIFQHLFYEDPDDPKGFRGEPFVVDTVDISAVALSKHMCLMEQFLGEHRYIACNNIILRLEPFCLPDPVGLLRLQDCMALPDNEQLKKLTFCCNEQIAFRVACTYLKPLYMSSIEEIELDCRAVTWSMSIHASGELHNLEHFRKLFPTNRLFPAVRLGNLERLSIHGMRLTLEGLQNLAQICMNLKVVMLDHCILTRSDNYNPLIEQFNQAAKERHQPFQDSEHFSQFLNARRHRLKKSVADSW